jgi:formiminoglutamase
MIDNANYRMTEPDMWQGRVDDPTDQDAFRIHQVVQILDLKGPLTVTDEKSPLCILGFCCDEGVRRNKGRIGAAEGPVQIRKELAKLPANFVEQATLYDAGNIYCVNGDLESAQHKLTAAVKHLLDNGFRPIVLGGGHEIVFGHYRGVREHVISKPNSLPPLIVNFDAHLDLRPINEGGTSGTSFNQIAIEHESFNIPFNYICLGTQTYSNTKSLYKRADKLGVEYVDAKDISEANKNLILERVRSLISEHQDIYLTLDFDVLNAANAPGVSSPQPFGMAPEMFLYLVKEVIRTGKVRSFDIAEVSPRYDDDNQTAKLAAVVIYSIINVMFDLN